MIRSSETAALFIAVIVAAVAGPPAARLHRRAVTRRPIDDRSASEDRPPHRLLVTGRRAVARLRPRRHGRPAPDALAAWCDAIGRRIRAGSTLRNALATSASADPALATAIGEIRLGLERGDPIVVALERPDPICAHLGLALAVISATSRLGGPSSQPLDRVAAALRLRAADEQERRAHSAQARMSAHVLTFVPLGFLGLMLALDDGVRTTATAPAGAAIIGAGLLLNGLGWFAMRTIIGRGSA